MEFSFSTPRVRKQCEVEAEMKKKHGVEVAKKLKRRLADMREAQTLEEMRSLPGKCHELERDRTGQLAIDVGNGKRLIFEPDPPQAQGKNASKLNWKEVTDITIVEIVDYHD